MKKAGVLLIKSKMFLPGGSLPFCLNISLKVLTDFSFLTFNEQLFIKNNSFLIYIEVSLSDRIL